MNVVVLMAHPEDHLEGWLIRRGIWSGEGGKLFGMALPEEENDGWALASFQNESCIAFIREATSVCRPRSHTWHEKDRKRQFDVQKKNHALATVSAEALRRTVTRNTVATR